MPEKYYNSVARNKTESELHDYEDMQNRGSIRIAKIEKHSSSLTGVLYDVYYEIL